MMLNFFKIKEALELINGLDKMDLQTVFYAFCEHTQQQIPQSLCDKFAMRGMSNSHLFQSDFLNTNGFQNIWTSTKKQEAIEKYYIVKYCNHLGDDGADPDVLIFEDEKIRDAFFSELVKIIKTHEKLLIIDDEEYEFCYEYSDNEDWTYSYTKQFVDDTQRTNVKSFFVNEMGRLVLQTDAGKDILFFI